MPLTRVSITGADDTVRPSDLVELSREFPFVEWGILFSESLAGSARYPTKDWRQAFVAIANTHKLQLAAHLCGKIAREMESGAETLWLPMPFQRVQLNGYAGGDLDTPSHHRLGVTFILQARGLSDFVRFSLRAADLNASTETGIDRMPWSKRSTASVLFDPSSGTGTPPTTQWPIQRTEVPTGYAGGIRPSNVRTVLGDLPPSATPVWIDMESGVRTNNVFDLARVRQVLEACAPFVQEAP